MPEKIRPVKGGYKVYTPNTGAHSKKPMTLRNAIRQANAIRASEHNPDWKRKKKKQSKN